MLKYHTPQEKIKLHFRWQWKSNTKNLPDTGRKLDFEKTRKTFPEKRENIKAIRIIKKGKAAGMSLGAIAHELNQNGLTTARGKEISQGNGEAFL